MSKFDTTRNFLEQVASPEGQKETLQALDLTYRNAREIISCYPEVATFLINVVNCVESFPLERLREARANMKKNNRIFCHDEDLIYREENWEKNIRQRLRTALNERLRMPLTTIAAIMNKIDSLQGVDYTKGEVFAFVQSRKAAGDLYLKASACSGDTYYLVKTTLRYVVLIQDPDFSGTLYEINR